MPIKKEYKSKTYGLKAKQLNKLLGEPTKELKIKRSISGSVWEIPLSDKIKIQRLIIKANIYEL